MACKWHPFKFTSGLTVYILLIVCFVSPDDFYYDKAFLYFDY